MSRINPEQSVIVFDLDDTLYAEYEYKCSGIRAVTALVAKLYPEFGETELLEKIDADGNGWLDELCALCNFNSEEKKSLLWYYRLHTPVLTPYWHPQKLAAFIRRFAAAALITDGRSLTQRLKLDALGIRCLFDEILVSESSGQEKPDGGRFYLLKKKIRHGQTLYLCRRQHKKRLCYAEKNGVADHRVESGFPQYPP